MMVTTIFVAFKHEGNTVKVFKDPLSHGGKENGLQAEMVTGRGRMNNLDQPSANGIN